MKRTAAGAALILSLLVGTPGVASAATTTAPVAPAVVTVPARQDDGNSEPPPPTPGEEEPPPPTPPNLRDRVNAAFDRAISRVQASPRIPNLQKQRVVRILERIQTRWR